MIPRIKKLEPLKDFKLHIEFDDGKTCVYWNDKIDLASDTIYEFGEQIC